MLAPVWSVVVVVEMGGRGGITLSAQLGSDSEDVSLPTRRRLGRFNASERLGRCAAAFRWSHGPPVAHTPVLASARN